MFISIPASSAASNHALFASIALAIAFSFVSPQVKHPGSSGNEI